MAPFVANNTIGVDGYKWILYGDDDTIFFLDNIVKVLETLDHSEPYLLSDSLWFPDRKTGEKLICRFDVLPQGLRNPRGTARMMGSTVFMLSSMRSRCRTSFCL